VAAGVAGGARRLRSLARGRCAAVVSYLARSRPAAATTTPAASLRAGLSMITELERGCRPPTSRRSSSADPSGSHDSTALAFRSTAALWRLGIRRCTARPSNCSSNFRAAAPR
jgi:hypothetical protein